MKIQCVQPVSALDLAIASGLKDGKTALVQLNTGATVNTEQPPGTLIAKAPLVTLHFCSSGWKILEYLPDQEIPEQQVPLLVRGELPNGIPPYAFIEGEFTATLREGRLTLVAPRLIRVAAIPKFGILQSAWSHPSGRRAVVAFTGCDSFDEWLDENCSVLRQN